MKIIKQPIYKLCHNHHIKMCKYEKTNFTTYENDKNPSVKKSLLKKGKKYRQINTQLHF